MRQFGELHAVRHAVGDPHGAAAADPRRVGVARELSAPERRAVEVGSGDDGRAKVRAVVARRDDRPVRARCDQAPDQPRGLNVYEVEATPGSRTSDAACLSLVAALRSLGGIGSIPRGACVGTPPK